MIYIDKKKLTVDGVDVYPDHESPDQFWYVPGTINLAQRNNRKLLSYLWYTDSESDSDGTGFLNFEVNTAVPDTTLDKIKSRIVSQWGANASTLSLSTVPFTGGNVNFSVLGPVAAQAAQMAKDTSVLYQSKEQLVWNAGSSSLVGDNAAVCSVRFTKEGKLAAAMKAAIQAKSPSIAATYRLEFLAMRPSVSFTVSGTFEKTIQDFKLSIGTQIPLEAFILDLGIQAQWQKIMQKTDLKIEVVNFTGDDQQDGLKWAQKILLDYVLKNFFEVQLGGGADNWNPLAEAPQVDEAVQKSKDVEQAAAEKVDEEGTAKTPEEKDTATKEAVKAATMFIPKVNIRASYYQGKQVNSIDFVYSEKKAKSYPVLPQALVGLEKDDRPEDYITQVNRAQDPFGLPYKVMVSVPSDTDFPAMGLQTINVQAKYPAGAPKDKQTTQNLTINAGTTTGANPFPFQYDAQGDSGIEYTADFVFKPTSDWQSDKDVFQYSLTGRTDKGLITARPESVVEFISLTVQLAANFVWENNDQVVVTFTSPKWTGEQRVVIQQGKEDPQTFKIRGDAKFASSPILYKVDVRKSNKPVYSLPSAVLLEKQLYVSDRFADHIPVYFTAGFTDDSMDVTLTYTDGDFTYEDQFTLEKGQKQVVRYIPTVTPFPRKSDVKATYEAIPDSGDPITGTISGGNTRIIKPRA